jgi:hypothetical protein
MSKTDTCTKCGREGHTASSCKRIVSAPHTSEPWDGQDRDMHKCSDCARLRRCGDYVPSIIQPIRCGRFMAIGGRA